jgi:hypothetical protein
MHCLDSLNLSWLSNTSSSSSSLSSLSSHVLVVGGVSDQQWPLAAALSLLSIDDRLDGTPNDDNVNTTNTSNINDNNKGSSISDKTNDSNGDGGDKRARLVSASWRAAPHGVAFLQSFRSFVVAHACVYLLTITPHSNRCSLLFDVRRMFPSFPRSESARAVSTRERHRRFARSSPTWRRRRRQCA